MNSTHCWKELKGGIQREVPLGLRAHVCMRACVHAHQEGMRPASLEVGTLRLCYQMRSVESCGRNGLHSGSLGVMYCKTSGTAVIF